MTPAPTATAPSQPPATGSTPPSAATAAAPVAPPLVTVLNASAIAALPFTLDLPSDFQIETGRPGPDFRVYTVRRGRQPFVMIYAGPAAQFPIYSGEMVQMAGRASVVATEDGQRHALEHLFQRSTAPREVHVWVSSLEGTDRALAERIAQSVDAR